MYVVIHSDANRGTTAAVTDDDDDDDARCRRRRLACRANARAFQFTIRTREIERERGIREMWERCSKEVGGALRLWRSVNGSRVVHITPRLTQNSICRSTVECKLWCLRVCLGAECCCCFWIRTIIDIENGKLRAASPAATIYATPSSPHSPCSTLYTATPHPHAIIKRACERAASASSYRRHGNQNIMPAPALHRKHKHTYISHISPFPHRRHTTTHSVCPLFMWRGAQSKARPLRRCLVYKQTFLCVCLFMNWTENYCDSRCIHGHVALDDASRRNVYFARHRNYGHRVKSD